MNKDRELYWLDIARLVRPDILSGELTSGESPDFIITDRGVKLGVEVTQYAHRTPHGEPPPEVQTGLRRKVMSLAKREFAKHSDTRVRVGCVFNDSRVLRNARVPTTAQIIAAHLLNRLDGKADWTRIRWDAEHDGDFSVPPAEISTLFASVIPSVANSHWFAADAGWVSNAYMNDIAATVARKEPKLPRYRLKCDRVLLLIVFDATPHGSRAIHAPEDPVPYEIATAFDGVLCLDALERRLVTIPVAEQPG